MITINLLTPIKRKKANALEKSKAARKRYAKSERGRLKRKEDQKRYMASEKGKKTHKKSRHNRYHKKKAESGVKTKYRLYNPRNVETKRVGAILTIEEWNKLQNVLRFRNSKFSDWIRAEIEKQNDSSESEKKRAVELFKNFHEGQTPI